MVCDAPPATLRVLVDLEGLLGGLAGGAAVLFEGEVRVGVKPVERAFDILTQVGNRRLVADFAAVLEEIDREIPGTVCSFAESG